MNIRLENIMVTAISCYLPEKRLKINDLSALFGEQEVGKIIEITGIKNVRVADEGMTSSDMCFNAATELISRIGISKTDIDGLVFVSQTPDYLLPSTAVCLQDRLGLSQESVCFDVPYGCSGYIYGLFLASMLISSKACRNVLVLAGDTSTKMINERDKAVRMVFGDAGSATLVSTGDKEITFSIHSDGSRFGDLIIPAGMFRNPSTEGTKKVTERENQNRRSDEDLFMDGMAIFDFAIHDVPDNINTLLESVSWKKEEVGVFALHQANSYMVNYVRKKLKADVEKTPIRVENYGNTGPASIPLVLCDVYHDAADLAPLKKSVLCGFGVGLSWGSVACDLSETRFFKPLNK
jgi:3-oxoacyl-[acyl-carrier-protein] synthase III